MKKFLAVMFVMLFAALALTACGFASEKDGAALAAGDSDYVYIRIAPSDDALKNSSTASPSAVRATNRSQGESVTVFLTEGYFYKARLFVKENDTFYILDDSLGFGFYIDTALPEDAVYPTLPEGAQASDALPDVALTLAAGKSVTLPNYITVRPEDEDYTFRFLGWAGEDADGERGIVFAADGPTGATLFGTAEADTFLPFTVPWHPLDEARRQTLLAPDEPADDAVPDDLTGGEPSDALRIILIIGIAVPALIIVFLLFKPSSDRRRPDERRRTVRGSDTRGGIDYDRERSYESDRERYERGYRDYERDDRDRRPPDEGGRY